MYFVTHGYKHILSRSYVLMMGMANQNGKNGKYLTTLYFASAVETRYNRKVGNIEKSVFASIFFVLN